MRPRFSGRAGACPCLAACDGGQGKTRWRAVALCGATILFGMTAAQAEPAQSYAEIFRQAETLAPRLAESGANVRAAEGQAVQAATRPNPNLTFEAENIGQNSLTSGPALSQNTLSVAQ